MSYNKLAADPTALILGILSVVIVFFGCCCGFLVGLSLVLSIAGLILSVKSLNEFDSNSENYSVQSRKNVFAGKVLSIIGLAFSVLYILIVLGFLIFKGQNITNEILKKYYESKEIQTKLEDSIQKIKIIDNHNQEADSIYSDSISVE